MESQPITIYLPDTKGVTVSPFGKGNTKLGAGVFTYSRLPGIKADSGTCPGASDWCVASCYAMRVTEEAGPVARIWARNTLATEVPPIPLECRLLRIHVSGDFDSVGYISAWIRSLMVRPDVRAWAYTRSWRVPALLPMLEVLRALPNVQLFASMDPSIKDLPPAGWRRAWVQVKEGQQQENRLDETGTEAFDGTRSLVCPEELGLKKDCEACKYCFAGKKADVSFIEH